MGRSCRSVLAGAPAAILTAPAGPGSSKNSRTARANQNAHHFLFVNPCSAEFCKWVTACRGIFTSRIERFSANPLWFQTLMVYTRAVLKSTPKGPNKMDPSPRKNIFFTLEPGKLLKTITIKPEETMGNPRKPTQKPPESTRNQAKSGILALYPYSPN